MRVSRPVTDAARDDEIVAWPDFLKPVYVISIRRWRMDNFVRRMGPWMRYAKRIDCVNGGRISTASWRARGMLSAGHGLSPGQIGAAGSHIRAWEAIASSSYPHGTVFEDDIALDYSTNGATLVQRIRDAVDELETSRAAWDIVWWGHGPWSNGTHAPAHGANGSALVQWKKPTRCPGFFAYTLTRDAARMLLKRVYPLRSAIDVWVTSLVLRAGLRALVLSPSLFFVVPGPSETTRLDATRRS